MEQNLAKETHSDLLSDAYNARSEVSGGILENWEKLFPSLFQKEAVTSQKEAVASQEDVLLSNVQTKEVEAAPPTRRVQPPRQAKPVEGSLHDDWLHKHLGNMYPDKEQWRALELFTEDALSKSFPNAIITTQATEVAGTRPDFVMKHEGKIVVIDAKCVTRGYIKMSDVDKLLRDMVNYKAFRGIIVARDRGCISEYLEKYCEENGVDVIEANRQLPDNLRKVVDRGTASKPSRAMKPPKKGGKAGLPKEKCASGDNAEDLGHLKKDGTPDMRFKKNQGRGDAVPKADVSFKKVGIHDVKVEENAPRRYLGSDILGPLKKDGTPDMRLKKNQVSKAESQDALEPLKKDGPPYIKMRADAVRISSASKSLGPLKKDGTPDMRFKQNQEAGDASSEEDRDSLKKYGTSSAVIADSTLGPLKKDGTPDRRFKVNKESSPVIKAVPKKVDAVSYISPSVASGYAAGPLKKDGTPDMRYKANYESLAIQHDNPSWTYPSYSRPTSLGFSGSKNYSYNGNPSGPLTKSGRPDMRYNANRY